MDPRDLPGGGPAFPTENGRQVGNNAYLYEGMTLRDYFAAKSILIMWDAYDKGYCGMNGKDEPNIKIIAEGAYQLADAMLAARG